MIEFIMTWLDPISIVVGLIATVPIFWTWWEVAFGRRRRHAKWYKDARSGKAVDAVLIVDLLAKEDMRPEIVRFLAGKGIGIANERIFELNEHCELKAEHLPELVTKLREKIGEISRLAPGHLHLFYGGPAAFAMVVGAELANKGNIHIYQRTNGQYYDWGPIRHAHF